MSEPKTGWAGVSHTDEGIVKLIHDHDEYGKLSFSDRFFINSYIHSPYKE